MTSEEVANIVKTEIGINWDISNAHGVDLRKCLVQPEKKNYKTGTNGEMRELWLVLEEDPIDRLGYKIVFDEKRRKFGLATTTGGSDIDFFLGIYGNFLATLEAM